MKYILSFILFGQLGVIAMSQSWIKSTSILPNAREHYSLFGNSIDYENNTLLIGAPYSDLDSMESNPQHDAGSAYFFEKQGSSWIQIKKFTPDHEIGLSPNLGSSVKLCGEYAFVGAPYGIDSMEHWSGVVYVLQKENAVWNLKQKLYSGSSDYNSMFGVSIAAYGNNLAIGCPVENHGIGAVYMYHLENGLYVFNEKITPTDQEPEQYFGWSLDISENRLIAGAYGNSYDTSGLNPQSDAGAAFIFKKNNENWELEAKLIRKNRKSGDQLGYTVAIENDIVAVGVPYAEYLDTLTQTLSYENTGCVSIYFFESGRWQENQQIWELYPGAHFGSAIDLGKDKLLVGAPERDLVDPKNNTGNPDEGVAYLYKMNNRNYELFTRLNDDEYYNDENFGTSVKLLEDTIFVGKPNDVYPDPLNNMIPYHCGSVCMFVNNQEVLSGSNLIKVGFLKIYPNPTSSYVNVRMNEPYNFLVTDVAGNLLCRKSINQSDFVMDLSSYPAGIYIFSIKSKSQTDVIKVIRK